MQSFPTLATLFSTEPLFFRGFNSYLKLQSFNITFQRGHFACIEIYNDDFESS